MDRYVKLTKVLFLDSKIPEQLELGRTKLGYLLEFGFSSILQGTTYLLIISSYWFWTKNCILLQRGIQSHLEAETNDVHVFYLHEEKQQLVRSYKRSHFLGHANAEETFQSKQAVHGNIPFGASFNGWSKCE